MINESMLLDPPVNDPENGIDPDDDPDDDDDVVYVVVVVVVLPLGPTTVELVVDGPLPVVPPIIPVSPPNPNPLPLPLPLPLPDPLLVPLPLPLRDAQAPSLQSNPSDK